MNYLTCDILVGFAQPVLRYRKFHMMQLHGASPAPVHVQRVRSRRGSFISGSCVAWRPLPGSPGDQSMVTGLGRLQLVVAACLLESKSVQRWRPPLVQCKIHEVYISQHEPFVVSDTVICSCFLMFFCVSYNGIPFSGLLSAMWLKHETIALVGYYRVDFTSS